MTAREILHDKVERLLQDLGDTPETVAAYLEGQGITGHRQHAFACPISRYLSRVTGLAMVSATPATTALYGGDGRGPVIVLLPSPVRVFISQFDHGSYETLRTPPRRVTKAY